MKKVSHLLTAAAFVSATLAFAGEPTAETPAANDTQAPADNPTPATASEAPREVAPPAVASAATAQQGEEAPPVGEPGAESAPVASAASASETSVHLRNGLTPVGVPDGCEMHIFPAERMASQTTGWLSGFGIIGALADSAAHAKGDSERQSLLASALDSPSQLDALTALDLRTLLNATPGTTLVIHEAPLERKTMNAVKTRRAESASKCYSELIVADVLYRKAAIYGRSLQTLFMYRNFGDDQKIDRQYKSWGGNGLKLFPPEEGQDAVAALDELVGTFKKNFDEYAGKARLSFASDTKRR